MDLVIEIHMKRFSVLAVVKGAGIVVCTCRYSLLCLFLALFSDAASGTSVS
jgi:hypothetical protein